MRVGTLVDGGVDAVRALIAVGAVAAALLFVLVPRRFAALTIVAVAAFLRCPRGRSPARYATRRTPARGNPHREPRLDRRARRACTDVPFIFTPDLVANPHLLWQTEFWNRSVGDVYGLECARPDFRAGSSDDHRRPGPDRPGLGRRPCRHARGCSQPGIDIAGSRSPLRSPGVVPGEPTATAREPARRRLRGGMVRAERDVHKLRRTWRHGPGRCRPSGWGGQDTPSRVNIAVERLTRGALVSEAVGRPQRPGPNLPAETPAAPYRVKVNVQPTFSPRSSVSRTRASSASSSHSGPDDGRSDHEALGPRQPGRWPRRTRGRGGTGNRIRPRSAH